jgi:hypothetical protein
MAMVDPLDIDHSTRGARMSYRFQDDGSPEANDYSNSYDWAAPVETVAEPDHRQEPLTGKVHRRYQPRYDWPHIFQSMIRRWLPSPS